jgi:hypothetical protein
MSLVIIIYSGSRCLALARAALVGRRMQTRLMEPDGYDQIPVPANIRRGCRTRVDALPPRLAYGEGHDERGALSREVLPVVAEQPIRLWDFSVRVD